MSMQRAQQMEAEIAQIKDRIETAKLLKDHHDEEKRDLDLQIEDYEDRIIKLEEKINVEDLSD